MELWSRMVDDDEAAEVRGEIGAFFRVEAVPLFHANA